MERDFMGLCSNKDSSSVVVKEEAVEGFKEQGFSKASAVQWSFQNAFDASSSRRASEVQKNIYHDRQGGTNFTMTAHPMSQNAHSLHIHQAIPVNTSSSPVPVSMTSSPVPVNMSSSLFKNNISASGQNFAGGRMKQQFLGGVPVTVSHSILPSTASFAGTTEPLFNSKAPCGPAQLTIFYGGMVNVFEDIYPEKAQAIMFLAGNGTSNAAASTPYSRAQVQTPSGNGFSNAASTPYPRAQVQTPSGNGTSNVASTPYPRAQVQTPSTKVGGADVFANQHVNASLCSRLSSPISVSSHSVVQPGCNPTKVDEQAKMKGGSATPISIVDSSMASTSIGPKTVTSMVPSAVPQARKASLARFLEKRKERVMNSASAPYSLNKKPDVCTLNS